MARVVGEIRFVHSAKLAVAVLLLVCSGVTAAPIRKSISDTSEYIQAELLGNVRGLDSRQAHFIICRDISGSTVDLRSAMTHILDGLVQDFFCDGDTVTLIGFARDVHPSKHYEYRTGPEKQVITAALSMPLDTRHWGTDNDEPVRDAMRYARDKGFGDSPSHLLVVIRFADGAESDIPDPKDAADFLVNNPEQFAEYQALIGEMTTGDPAKPRQSSCGPFQFSRDEVGDPTKKLYVTIWARQRYADVPVVAEIDRERKRSDFSGLSRMRYLPDEPAIRLSWRAASASPSSGAISAYRVFLSNQEELLNKALGERDNVSGVAKWDFVPSDLAPDEADPRYLCKVVNCAELKGLGLKVDQGAELFGAARVVYANGQADSNSYVRALVLKAPPAPPRSAREQAFEALVLLQMLLALIAVVATISALRLSHVVMIGARLIKISLRGRGAPVVASTRRDDQEKQSNTIFVRSGVERSELEGAVLGYVVPAPVALPSFMRFGLAFRPADGVRATVNGRTDLALPPGDTSQLQMVATQHDNAVFALDVTTEDFRAKHRASIITLGLVWLLNVVCFVALLINWA